MSYVLSIDPGLNHAGVALWDEGGTLVRAWLARSSVSTKAPLGNRWLGIALAIGEGDIAALVIERPQIYRVSPGDPNDLLSLAGVVGCIVGVLQIPAVTYLPREWKGQEKKERTLSRILLKLTTQEACRVETRPASLAHNVWDAVGIGLHYLKRM